MYSYFFKRCISMVFILMILFINIFSCYCVVHADTQSSGGHFGSKTDFSAFNKVYEGFDFSDTIAKHESFYFTDSIGNKHAVARVGSAWICLFGSRATFNGSQDDLLNYYLSYYAYTGYRSISNSFCALMASQLGSITKGGYTLVENALSSNIKNVADNITYNESDDSISLNNSAVDKLREEIKKYYYDSIGIVQYKATGTFSSYINNKDFTHLFEYDEDIAEAYNKISKYKYALCDRYRNGSTDVSEHSFLWDSSDYLYLSESDGYVGGSTGNWCSRLMSYSNNKGTNFVDTTVSYTYYGISSGSYSTFSSPVTGLFWNPKGSYYNHIYPCSSSEKTNIIVGGREYSVNAYKVSQYYPFEYYSYDGSSLLVFKSFSSMYNYLNGDQNAFLSSEIKKTGEDITFSIKDMNENLGNKMDALIDSINDKKGSMTADELQNSIDKGLKDLNKNTEDIKDDTSDILDVLKEQNQILLDILGVTTNIYKVVKDSDSKDKTYNVNYVQSVFNSMFKGLKNAILYGENTVRDDVSEDTDDIDSIVSDIPPDKKNYHNGLFGRFPFSVPYQLFDWLQALYLEPVAPKFTLSYAYLFRDLGYETNNFEFVIDLGDKKYSKWIELVRSGEKLSFIIYMAIATYHRFKNEI